MKLSFETFLLLTFADRCRMAQQWRARLRKVDRRSGGSWLTCSRALLQASTWAQHWRGYYLKEMLPIANAGGEA